MQLYGVWQGGLLVTYVHYSTEFHDVILGTHVGNYPHVVKGEYDGDFDLSDHTYNLSYCASYTEAYIATYGATYAAVFYRELFCNVRALEWV